MAERLLQELGVERPEEIDVEAIAWDLGAKVRSRKLSDCEARIVGVGDRAIITIDEDVSPRRRRFSIAHELGHWRHHRDRCLICRSDMIGNARASALDPERIADEYASDLLLPRFILEPILRDLRKPTLGVLRDTADAFDTSLTATLLKIVEVDRWPMLAICSGAAGRRWFRASASVPPRWSFPRKDLDSDSFAMSLLSGSGSEDAHPRRIGADAWFDGQEAEDFELTEQSYALPGGEVVTIIHIIDDDMLGD